MTTDTETFYVVANISGGYSRPTFVKNIGSGYTDAWGSASDATAFDSRKDAQMFIDKHFPDNKGRLQPMRVRVDVKLYN